MCFPLSTSSRRDTLTVQPPSYHHSQPHHPPDIRVQRASFAASGHLTLSDISSDELSWDSELDAPSSPSDDEDSAPPRGPGRRGLLLTIAAGLLPW